MDIHSLSTAVLEPLEIAPHRLFRVSPELYHSMIEHGLLVPREFALIDGLLVREPEPRGGNGEGVTEALDRLYRMPLDVYDRLARSRRQSRSSGWIAGEQNGKEPPPTCWPRT
jgi:hypothetical protein